MLWRRVLSSRWPRLEWCAPTRLNSFMSAVVLYLSNFDFSNCLSWPHGTLRTNWIHVAPWIISLVPTPQSPNGLPTHCPLLMNDSRKIEIIASIHHITRAFKVYSATEIYRVKDLRLSKTGKDAWKRILHLNWGVHQIVPEYGSVYSKARVSLEPTPQNTAIDTFKLSHQTPELVQEVSFSSSATRSKSRLGLALFFQLSKNFHFGQ